MDSIITTIINATKPGQSNLIPTYDAYAVYYDGKRGLAIKCEADVKIKENFNSVRIQDADITIGNRNSEHFVFLYSETKEFDVQYDFLCESFLADCNRDTIKKNPIQWFNSWKQLIGNTATEKMVYDVLGELFVLDALQKKNLSPTWDSMESGTFDISTSNIIFEVKSTICKTVESFVAHSQFQLDVEKLKVPLYISFVVLEENKTGTSIDDLMKSLKNNGYEFVEKAEKYLAKKGLGVGTQYRMKKYNILKTSYYPVNEKFPKIVPASFKGDNMPTGISAIEYTVSLNGLTSKTLNEIC